MTAGRRALRIGVLAAAALASLRFVACSADEESSPTDPASTPEAGTSEDGSAPGPEDPRPPGDGGPTPAEPPSYCAGLLLYASFDAKVTPEVGDTNPRVSGMAGIGAGRFGSGLSFVDLDASVGSGDGGLVFYDRVDGGAPFFSTREGTVAFWMRVRGTPRATAAWVRPLGTGVTAAGPVTSQTSPSPGLGLYRDLGNSALATISDGELAPFVRAGDWNLVVTGWRAPEDGGALPYALVAVNGGLGEVLTDGGPRDASRDDAAPDDAGNVTTPYYRRTTPTTWPAYAPLTTLRLGGVVSTVPAGDMDDLAVWSRELTRDEMTALYKSSVSIRTACKLP